MKTLYKNAQLSLFPENKQELRLLESDYVKSKLAFQMIDFIDGEFEIAFECDETSLNMENMKATICRDVQSEGDMTFLLRIFLDAYVLHHGGLPLHASLTAYNNKAVFLLGDTNCGKSRISSLLKLHKLSNYVVGDDHIYVHKQGFFGNSIMRQRSTTFQQNHFEKNEKTFLPYRDYFIFNVKIANSVGNYKEIEGDSILGVNVAPILKYLLLGHHNTLGKYTCKRLISQGVLNAYEDVFQSFLYRAEGIYMIEGSEEYIEKMIQYLLYKSN